MQERYIATVDLGTSKLALCVAKVVGENVQIIYYKERPSDGIRYNCVFNPKRAAVPLRVPNPRDRKPSSMTFRRRNFN